MWAVHHTSPPHFTRCPTHIPAGMHFTHNRYHKMNNLSTKVNQVFEGEEGRWKEVVKRQVNKSLESVSENIKEVHNVKRGQKQKGN